MPDAFLHNPPQTKLPWTAAAAAAVVPSAIRCPDVLHRRTAAIVVVLPMSRRITAANHASDRNGDASSSAGDAHASEADR